MPRQLAAAASDLEYPYFTNEPETHRELGRRILGPVMSEIEGEE
jgi:hypothetical protein